MRRLSKIILTLVAVATLAITSLIAWRGTLEIHLGAEGYKQSLQLFVATIIGGLISSLISEIKREQDRLAAHRLHLLSFYNSILLQYNKSKKIRRLLRPLISVHSLPYSSDIFGKYEELMHQLEDVQLEFESFRRQVQVQASGYPSPSEIIAHTDKIQKYLRSVVREYEDGAHKGLDRTSILGMSKLRSFIDERESWGKFVDEVAIPFEFVESILLKSLNGVA